MLVTHDLHIDLAHRGYQPVVAAVQGEANTRQLSISLFSNRNAWTVPAGATAAVAFLKPDGTRGLYDKLPNGDPATAISGNTVTAILAPQALTCAGTVLTSVVFYDVNMDTLATFPFKITVEKNPAAGQTVSNDYYSYSTMEEVNAAIDEAFVAIREAEDNCAPAIVCEASGSIITLNDSSNRLLNGLVLYGKTAQDGTPTPENPVDLATAGASGSVCISITDGTDENMQSVTASTPNGLPGIPVSRVSGNYTDANGQQWICDTIDFTQGIYTKRVETKIITGTENWKKCNPETWYDATYYLATGNGSIAGYSSYENYCLCNQYIPTSRASIQGVTTPDRCAIGASGREITFTSNLATAEEWKAELAQKYAEGNPVIIQYVKSTPVETPLSSEEIAAYAALRTNKPETVVYNDGGAWMKLEYTADTKIYIDQKLAAISAAMLNA